MTGGPHREAPRPPASDATRPSAEAPNADELAGPGEATGEAGRTQAQAAPGETGQNRGEAAAGETAQTRADGAAGGDTPPAVTEEPPPPPPEPARTRPEPARPHRPEPAPTGPEPDRAGPEPARAQPGPNRLWRPGNPDRGYLIAGAVVKPLMRVWFRMRVEGREHVPAEGPVILASNHRSNMDPVLLASAVKRPVAFMAKAELFVGPLGWIMRWIGQFPVRRGGIDREALRRTDALLARGSMLGLFPEGTRGDGRFSAVHPGLAYIVVRQRCPVLPVAIFGTERVRRRFGWLPFASPVRVVIGPAIDLPPSSGDRAGRRAASEVLRQRLQAFLATASGVPSLPATSSQVNE
jgi:1-acyl-sn-glycerol-3-phosphate acyltransferase